MALCLQRLGTFGPLRCGEMYAMDRLLREARVLQLIRRITKENPRRSRQPAEGKLNDSSPEADKCCSVFSQLHK